MTREEFISHIFCRNFKINIFWLRTAIPGEYIIIIENGITKEITFSPRVYTKAELDPKITELKIYHYKKYVVSN